MVGVAPVTVRAYQVTEDWVPAEVSWNRRSSAAAWSTGNAGGAFMSSLAIGGISVVPALNTKLDISLDPAVVRRWSWGLPNYGFILKADTESGTSVLGTGGSGFTPPRFELRVIYR